MLIREEKGTKFGWTLSPWKPYLTKRNAIIVAIIQVVLAFVIPFVFLTDFFVVLFCSFESIVYPVSLIVFYTVYLTSIRSRLDQYNFSWKEILISIMIYGLAGFWLYLTVNNFNFSIPDPTSSFCSEIFTKNDSDSFWNSLK